MTPYRRLRCPDCGWRTQRRDVVACRQCNTPLVEALPRPPKTVAVLGTPMILPPPPLTGHQYVLWAESGVPYYRACLIVQTYGTHTAEQQAALLGLAFHTVYAARKRLRKVGLLHSTQRLTRRPYSADEIGQVQRLMSQGWTGPMIRQATGIPLSRIWGISERYVRPSERPGRSLTMQDVVNIFGTRYAKVYQWVEAGWLTPVQQHLEMPPEKRPIHVFYRDDLADFIRLREAWMTYDPKQITDPALRKLAEAVRAAAGGRWVQLKAIAETHHFTPLIISDWRERGWPGAQWEVVKRVNTWWLWLPNGCPIPDPPPDRRYQTKQKEAHSHDAH